MTQASTLSELAVSQPAAARVFQRLRLDFCCGGRRSLADACQERGVDPEAVLRAIAAESAALPAVRWDREPLPALIQHIVTAYHDPLREELPRLIALAKKVETRHAGHAECPRGLAQELEAMRSDALDHLDKEEGMLFPMIARGDSAQGPVRVLEEEHAQHAAHLSRLRALTRDFVPPDEGCTTWRALYLGLAELERALMEHMHLENNVLFPRSLTESRKAAS